MVRVHAMATLIESAAGGSDHAAAHRSCKTCSRCHAVKLAAPGCSHGAPAHGGGARIDSPRTKVCRISIGRPQWRHTKVGLLEAHTMDGLSSVAVAGASPRVGGIKRLRALARLALRLPLASKP